MSKPLRLLLLIIGTLTFGLAAYALGAWDLVTSQENLEKHPPELDALKADILEKVHLEPTLEANGELGAKLRSTHVVVTFDFVPTMADKKELEQRTRQIVQKHVPTATSIQVELRERR
jgi:hypothetical protein